MGNLLSGTNALTLLTDSIDDNDETMNDDVLTDPALLDLDPHSVFDSNVDTVEELPILSALPATFHSVSPTAIVLPTVQPAISTNIPPVIDPASKPPVVLTLNPASEGTEHSLRAADPEPAPLELIPLPPQGSTPYMVSPNPMRLIQGIKGKQFPVQAKQVTWEALGVDTYLPWIARKNCNSRDALAVENLLQFPNATEPSDGMAIVQTLQAPTLSATGQQMDMFHSQISNALANGILVVVKGWHSDYFTQFTLRSFEEAGCHANQTVCAHGTFHPPTVCLQV
jgi:hypothetical protein